MIRYALVDGVKMEPQQGLTGTCPGCNSRLVAKCGQINIHHWAHKSKRECDSWWEPLTQWHIDWQNQFPKEWREVIFTDNQSKEIHRADIYTAKGITIEFQNSSISSEEIKSRNDFYPKLIWVVNAQKFKDGFECTINIPNPTLPLLADFEFAVDTNGFARHLIFYQKSTLNLVHKSFAYEIYGLNHPKLTEVAEFHQANPSLLFWAFIWKHKHKAWFASTAPVFFDFGDDFLYLLKRKVQTINDLWYVKIFRKTEFIAKYTDRHKRSSPL